MQIKTRMRCHHISTRIDQTESPGKDLRLLELSYSAPPPSGSYPREMKTGQPKTCTWMLRAPLSQNLSTPSKLCNLLAENCSQYFFIILFYFFKASNNVYSLVSPFSDLNLLFFFLVNPSKVLSNLLILFQRTKFVSH